MNCEGLLVNLEHHCINIKYFTHLKKKTQVTLSNKKLKYESREPQKNIHVLIVFVNVC